MGDAAYFVVGDEIFFDEDAAICQLIADGAVFIGGPRTPFFEPAAGEAATLWINCNDLWAWATADAEPLDYTDIEEYYIAYCDPRRFSISKWICKRYRRLPMPEIICDMTAAGVWDDEMVGIVAPDADRR